MKVILNPSLQHYIGIVDALKHAYNRTSGELGEPGVELSLFRGNISLLTWRVREGGIRCVQVVGGKEVGELTAVFFGSHGVMVGGLDFNTNRGDPEKVVGEFSFTNFTEEHKDSGLHRKYSDLALMMAAFLNTGKLATDKEELAQWLPLLEHVTERINYPQYGGGSFE